MDLQLVPVAQFQTFLLCLARVIALVAAIPAFAGVAASLRMKLGLGVATALVLFPLMAPHTPRVDFTLTDGLMAVHRGEAEVVLSFEWDGDVDRLSEVLKSRGFVSRVIDEAYGRSLRIDDPDGGVELWVNERQSDLYGYREG